MWKRREDPEVPEDDNSKEDEEEGEDDGEVEGTGEDGAQGRHNSTMVGDNAHMAQASDNPWLNWKSPAFNSLTKSPKGGKLVRGPNHKIVGGSDPPALRNGQAEGGDLPSDPLTFDPFEDEEEIEAEFLQEQTGDVVPVELEEQHPQVGDIEYLGALKMCLECAYAPCICTILKAELKLKALKVINNTNNKIERKRKRSEDECEKECGHSECRQQSVGGHSLCPTTGSKDPENKENKEEELTTNNKEKTTPYKDNKISPTVAVANKTTPETTKKIPTKNISKLLKTTLSMFENNIKNKQQTLQQQTTKKFNLQQPKLKLLQEGANSTTKRVSEEKQQSKQQEKELRQQENEASREQTTNKNTTNNINKKDEETTSLKTTQNNKLEETTSTQEEIQKLAIKLQQPKLKLKQTTLSGTTTPKTTNETKKTTTRKKKPDNKPRKQPSITGYITTNKQKQEDMSTTNKNTTHNKPEVTTNNKENKPTATKGTKTTTTDTRTTTDGDKTTKTSNDSTTTTPNYNKQQPKLRHKPPNIDQLTPVNLAVKVRGTTVTDLKEFLARKKSERDSAQAKRLRAPEPSGGNNSTLSKPNTGTGRTRQELGN